VAAAVIGVLAAGLGNEVFGVGTPSPVDPEAQQLRTALAMARTDSFYLVLDLREEHLTVMLGAVPLRTFVYAEAAIGGPRLRLGSESALGDWTARVWRDGTLDPAPERERHVIETPKADSTASQTPAAIPPTVEESMPAPARYRLRFSGGFCLEVQQSGSAGAWYRPGTWWLRLAGPGSDPLRVRLSLDDDDADTLYRCLPPGLPLIVIGQLEGAGKER
jgi:hypothetical protein